MARLSDYLQAIVAPKIVPTVVVLDNVAKYWFDVLPDEWSYADFPQLRLPISPVFFEYRYSEWRSDIGFHAVSFDGAGTKNLLAEFPDLAATVGTQEVAESLYLTGFQKDQHRGAALRPAVLIPLKSDGSVGDGRDPWHLRVPGELRWSDDDVREWAKLVLPVLLGISFMHCKNVTRTVVTPPAPLDKKWQKKTGKPLVRYHVLNIDPMRQILKHEGRSEETGLKKALHICRGHFATYTEAAPLFGKVTGTFWKPQHVRGSLEHGAVIKDYNVKAPPA